MVEKWLESKDGTVGGLVDFVVAIPGGGTIKDYKSGPIYRRTLEGKYTVDTAYEAQLKLYASLFRETFGWWPTSLELAPLKGEVVEVVFSPGECANLLTEAKEALADINLKISNHDSTQSLPILLAKPKPDTCKFCPYRPVCKSYQATRETDEGNSPWPKDMWGKVVEIQELGNGKVSIGVSNHLGDVRRIRGITPDPDRHPAMGHIQIGDMLLVFDAFEHRHGSLSECPATSMYLTKQVQ